MNLAPLNKLCPLHPNLILADVCTADRCDHRLLCMKCRQTHTTSHSRSLTPLVQIFHNDFHSQSKLKNQQHQQTIQRIEAAFEDLERQMLKVLHKTKQEFLDVINSGSDKLQWENYKKQYNQSFVKLFKDSDPTSHDPLRKFINSYIDMSKLNVHTQSIEKTFDSILEKLFDQFEDFQGVMTYLVDLARFEQGNEAPSFVNVTKLQVEKLVQGEARVFPQSIEYMKDLDMVVTGDSEGNIAFWNGEDMQKICSLSIHNRTVYNLKYCWERNLIITGFTNGYLKVLKVNPKLLTSTNTHPERGAKIISTHKKRTNAVRSLLILHNQSIFLAAGRDPNIEIWSLSKLKQIGLIDTKGRGQIGYQMAYIPRSKSIVAGFKDGMISIFGLHSKTELTRFNTGYQGWFIDCVKYLKIEDAILASVSEETVKKWKLNSEVFESREYKVPKGVEHMLVVDGEEKVLMGNMGSKFLSLNLKDGYIQETVDTGVAECTGLVYLQKHNKFALADWDSKKISVMKYNQTG